MAFTDSLPIAASGYQSNGSTGNTQCGNAAGNMLTDNGTLGLIRQISELDGSTSILACYAPSICELTRFDSITIPVGATITGVRFTVDARAAFTNLATGLQYQISVDNAASFTTAAALDLTGANNLKGATQEFHTTSGTTELHGLTWPTADSDYDSPSVRFRFSLNSGEAVGKAVEVDFVKLRVYYSEAAPPRSTYSNATDEQVISANNVAIKNGLLKF